MLHEPELDLLAGLLAMGHVLRKLIPLHEICEAVVGQAVVVDVEYADEARNPGESARLLDALEEGVELVVRVGHFDREPATEGGPPGRVDARQRAIAQPAHV